MNKNRIRMIFGTTLLSSVLLLGLYGIGVSVASDKYDRDYYSSDRDYDDRYKRKHDDDDDDRYKRKYDDDDDRYKSKYKDDKKHRWNKESSSLNKQQTAMGALYKDECGSCHMAYPIQLLPTRSWEKIMQGLDDHFGESAELDAQTHQELKQYLVSETQQTPHRKYRKMLRDLGPNPPIRITELPYFIHEHDEIPSRFIEKNDKVGSLSQCSSCHRNAEKGWFDEDDIYIPGVGRWDD